MTYKVSSGTLSRYSLTLRQSHGQSPVGLPCDFRQSVSEKSEVEKWWEKPGGLEEICLGVAIFPTRLRPYFALSAVQPIGGQNDLAALAQ